MTKAKNRKLGKVACCLQQLQSLHLLAQQLFLTLGPFLWVMQEALGLTLLRRGRGERGLVPSSLGKLGDLARWK